MGPLLDLLSADYTEIQENALESLIKCAEDSNYFVILTKDGNRIEIRKLNGIKKLVDLLALNINILQPKILICLTLCLEDNESCSIFPDTGGLPVLISLASSEDVKIRRMAALVIHKIARIGN